MSILLKPTATFATTLSLEPASITLLLMMSVNTQTRASLSLTRCRRASADNELSEFKSTEPISWSLAITDEGRLRVTRMFIRQGPRQDRQEGQDWPRGTSRVAGERPSGPSGLSSPA